MCIRDRQHPLKAGYVLDFYCAEEKLGIEIDGGYHENTEQQEKDNLRTREIAAEYGIRIIRFSNEEVLFNTEEVLMRIAKEMSSPQPSPIGKGVASLSPLHFGEGSGVRTIHTVLMLDARKIYRKVTTKVNDFSPEQLQNLICIVNLYRGNTEKFESTVKGYLQTVADLAKETALVTAGLQATTQSVFNSLLAFFEKMAEENNQVQPVIAEIKLQAEESASLCELQNTLIADVRKAKVSMDDLENIAHLCKHLRKLQDKQLKQLFDLIGTATKEYQLNKNKDWKAIDVQAQCIAPLKALQLQLSGNPDEEEPGLLHDTEYFWKQAHWLTSRFPDGVYADVEGLCKVVTRAEIEAKDWSLSPGRYVGVDTAVDEDFDYEERLAEIHLELEGLNEEAVELAKLIADNYKGLAV
jgi:type I restriction enzyme M protein